MIFVSNKDKANLGRGGPGLLEWHETLGQGQNPRLIEMFILYSEKAWIQQQMPSV